MKISWMISFLGCLSLTLSLHLTHHISSSYLDYLRNQHQTVGIQVQALQQDLTSTSDKLNNQTDIDVKISILEKAILRQKVIVRQLSVYDSQNMNCYQQITYVTNIAAGGDKLILPQGTTIYDLQQEQEQENENKNVENCPAEKPFLSEGKCISCEDETYFSIQSLSCQECEEGALYDVDEHECKTTVFYSNLNNPYWTSTNVQDTKETIQELSQNQQNTQCQYDEPFYNGQSCIFCSEDQVFSFDALECKNCPDGQVFSSNLHSCVVPLGLYQTNPETAPNLIFGGLSKNEWVAQYDKVLEESPSTADCPSQKPFFDGVTCVICPESHPYFNLNLQRCQVCDIDSEYNDEVHECLSSEGNIVDQTPNIEKMAAGIFT